MLEPDRIEMDVRLLGVVNNVITAHRLPRLTRHQTDPINAILLQHVQHQLGRPLKMTRWVVAPMRATHRSQRPASSETDLAHL
jgi:hypothetical protein